MLLHTLRHSSITCILDNARYYYHYYDQLLINTINLIYNGKSHTDVQMVPLDLSTKHRLNPPASIPAEQTVAKSNDRCGSMAVSEANRIQLPVTDFQFVLHPQNSCYTSPSNNAFQYPFYNAHVFNPFNSQLI